MLICMLITQEVLPVEESGTEMPGLDSGAQCFAAQVDEWELRTA